MGIDKYKIYPKQFRGERIPVEKNRCFCIMPFAENFDIIYGNIKQSLSNSEYICVRVDEISGSTPIINKILAEILKAQFIIVDLTGGNPNVFYELGIAHTFKDADNIFLIKEKGKKVPFDIMHLTYLEYDRNNLKFMISQLKQSIEEKKYISEFHEILNIKGITTISNDFHEEFLEYLQYNIEDYISTITSILSIRFEELEDLTIDLFFEKYQLLIHSTIDIGKKELLPSIMRLYSELIIACNQYIVSETQVSFFFNGFFSQHNISESEILGYQSDLAITLAKKKKLLSVVLPWIIQYFTRSKSANVDLNRYKLEGFLMTTTHNEIDKAMINALFSKDCHIREHIADIIGEKHLIIAKDALFCQLAAEENYYSAVSIIEAIGKLGLEEGINVINSWLNHHQDDIIKCKMFFILRHIQITFSRLDKSSNGDVRKEFAREYGQYLTEYVPL